MICRSPAGAGSSLPTTVWRVRLPSPALREGPASHDSKSSEIRPSLAVVESVVRIAQKTEESRKPWRHGPAVPTAPEHLLIRRRTPSGRLRASFIHMRT